MASSDPLEDEFRDFVTARSSALLRTAYLLTGDWGTAEDLLQTALTKTYLAWKRLGGIEAIEPYARRVMVNTSTSWWRRRWHGERPTEVLPERPGVDEIEQQLDRDVLWRHLRALPARQRAVLVLRFYEDLSESQIAALLNISTGTVKSQTSRALATLRRRIGADEAFALPGAASSSVDPPRRAGTATRTGQPLPTRQTRPDTSVPATPAPATPTGVPEAAGQPDPAMAAHRQDRSEVAPDMAAQRTAVEGSAQAPAAVAKPDSALAGERR
ncbi:SigE family RNA polymerase sigma factor [Verrucosispora sp. FIM060022]|uniref:SigE family RNA polymerase sigma factor n=1 Tax=Verrucosispora sp. FIM060022 TaxID=1479020 RepID=UPI000F8698FB|nr:SigE family RNA polymerase sigma factor [Verrucosispora sp. FIM060022]RUL92572.1 SigE family RNA polymerase sigma factor [Verrucosispora sp. FIM060022]